MNQRKKSPAHQQLGNPKSKIDDNTLLAQRKRILNWLEKKPLTTLEARHQLDILAPAARVFELRHIFGFNILTSWQIVETQQGCNHRVAKYILNPGRYQEQGGSQHG